MKDFNILKNCTKIEFQQRETENNWRVYNSDVEKQNNHHTNINGNMNQGPTQKQMAHLFG